jgi:putative membrane protein
MKAFASLFVSAAIISAVGPQPFLNWFAEAALILIAGLVLIATFPRYQLTGITYTLFLAFAFVVFVGAHYNYAKVPLGDWMGQAFGFRRNHFDRIGHVFQGVAPAILFRELLIRRVSFPRGKALFWVVCGLCLGVAAMFELLEWQYALIEHGPVPEDLGAQGDPWDAQADMLMALIGAATSQLTFAKIHDRQLTAEPVRASAYRAYGEKAYR